MKLFTIEHPAWILCVAIGWKYGIKLVLSYNMGTYHQQTAWTLLQERA